MKHKFLIIYRKIKFACVFVLAIITFFLFCYLLFLTYYQNRIFPGIKIASFDVGGQTPSAVRILLFQEAQKRSDEILQISYNDQIFQINPKDASPQIDISNNITASYSIGRSGKIIEDARDQLQALIYGLSITPGLTYQRPAALIYQFQNINRLIKKDPVNAKVVLGEDVVTTPSEDGLELDSKTLAKEIGAYLTLQDSAPEIIPVKTSLAKFSTKDAETVKNILRNIKDSPLILRSEAGILTINQVALFNLLDLTGEKQILPETSQSQGDILEEISKEVVIEGKNLADSQIIIDKEKLTVYLKTLSDKINRETKEAKFVFNPQTKRVSEFQSAQEGKKVDIDQMVILLASAVTFGQPKELDLPVKITKPIVTISDADNFGIRELLGEGVSNFAGSIDNRIYNIGLASSRIHGVLIAPGALFSFNREVGDISAASGYKQAYVIKSGRTVLDDGGGVCQVSTTLFRAVLNAGLAVVERTAHAYRVGYYEQGPAPYGAGQGFPPGLDATVFAPSVDFKFKNNTPDYILIQTGIKGVTLYIDIYGTGDGRIVSLSKPVITNQTPPPLEIRQDDPTLPRGQIKQVDWPAWGANVFFSRTVTRNGEVIISENWKSNYRPWQTIYLIGTRD